MYENMVQYLKCYFLAHSPMMGIRQGVYYLNLHYELRFERVCVALVLLKSLPP